MSQFRGNTGLLIVVVKRAKDLPNKRKMEKQSPYCLVRLMNQTDRTTTDVRGGQTPRWDDEFRFHISPEIQPVLKLSVLDETKKAPVLISETEIDFTPAFYSSTKEGYDDWFPLTYGGREAGEIYLEMTFYPSSMTSANSSYRKSNQEAHKPHTVTRRVLPPIPGQQSEPIDAEEPSFGSIPPPIARKIPNITASLSHDLPRSFHEFSHSDSFRPPLVQDEFSRSTISLHSLPDVPTHKSNLIDSHAVRGSPISKSPVREQSPISKSPTREQAPISTYTKDGDVKSSDTVFRSSLDPGRANRTSDLKAFAKKFTNKYNVPLFSSNKEPTSPQKGTNEFDDLEREVQSDWERNNPGNLSRHPRERSVSPQKAKVPPPVPSHGSSLNSSGGSNFLPSLPNHASTSSSFSKYEIIEPGSAGQERRKSPTRKPPTEAYLTKDQLDLSNLPYDANTISAQSHHIESSKIRNYDEMQSSSRDNDLLLSRHNAPTPYEAFVKHPGLQNSQTSVRSSPSRFKSSLPPAPPPH